MPEPRRIARVSPSVLSREVHGEAILLHLDSGEYFGLDTVGARVWQLIGEKGDLIDVEATLGREYDVDRARLARDVERIVAELIARHLIEIESVPA
jgi:hypothetical protein